MSHALELPAGTEEHLSVLVTLDRGSSDPTSATVELALVGPHETPVEDDWKTGDWAPDGPPYFARILVGPAQEIKSDAGTYSLWARFTDNPEKPIRRSGLVRFF